MRYYTIGEFAELLKSRDMLEACELYGKEQTVIRLLTYDSREVAADTMFICKGAAFKPVYLRNSVEQGAVCYISEKKFELEEEVPYLLVKDIRQAMPPLANFFYNKPWEDLKVTGVGGTKGKSTSVYYMKAIVDDYLAAQNKKDSAVISSIDIYDGKSKVESHITTPEAVELQRHFRNALDCGMEFVQMEISSQALKYHRVDGIMFDVAVFLNISEDHISPIEHEDFEDYFSSKMKMFAQTKTAIVNLDADYIDRILKEAEAAGEVITFSTKDTKADYYAYEIHKDGQDIRFKVKCAFFDEEFMLTMPGLFNVENALGVIAAAVKLKIPKEYIHSGLLRARSSGRMEMYASEDQKIIAIVDYAHNKLSFEKLFSSMREEYPDYGIVSIFGCPGKKALIRRRDLGIVAGRYSKKVYLAAEDPGYEPVEDISKDIAQYVEAEGCPYEMIEDRGEAIKAAIETAEGKTLLLVTGKGGETRQKYGSDYLDCPSDVEYVLKYLDEYNAGKKDSVSCVWGSGDGRMSMLEDEQGFDAVAPIID
ncbi:MAG: UDP-N-acetylmuramoyl-L-alanyl-D-glutamate--2,6-diaminopimelate ligase [Dorea sp.]|nr:UDP-N-acetylmuramoyl-L-alanyl-D-glutamate--2,6-diaminopimelate ligase [Dorea sp.]